MGTRKGIPADMVPTVDNILATFYEATDDELDRGAGWYAEAHRIALELVLGGTESQCLHEFVAPRSGSDWCQHVDVESQGDSEPCGWPAEDHPDVRIGAGVLAALSPQTAWGEAKGQNVELARRAFRQGKATGHTGDACNKATAILSSWQDPEDVLGGLKVRNFYAAIVDPNSATAVCIDRHAFDIAVGRVTDGTARTILVRVGVYDTFAELYREAARTIGGGITPAAVQAVTWLVWRRQKGIIDPEGRP